LHAAWVYLKEKGVTISLPDVVDPFVILSEKKRSIPQPENVKVYEKQKRTFIALSERVRGIAGAADPFAARAELNR